jgi:hypothetical protein
VGGSIREAVVPQARYQLTYLEIGGVDVPLASGQITKGVGAALWDVRAEGVPEESFDGLIGVLGPDAKDSLLTFTDDQGVSHQARCHVLRRAPADSGFNLSTGTLTFNFEGPIT